MIRFVSTASLCLALLATHAPADADCVVVNTNSGANSVASFLVNPDGTLTAAPGSPFPTGGAGGFNAAVGSIGICAAAGRVYATNTVSSPGTVSGFDVDPDTCVLTALPGSPWTAGTNAVGVTADPAGAFLYVTNFNGNDISVFAIAADGTLAEIAGSPLATPTTPFDIEFAPAGDRFFVSHDFDDSVGAYTPAPDGTFTPVAGSPFAAGGTEHGLGLNPGATRLYVADVAPATVTGYSIGGGGALTPLAGSPYGAGSSVLEVLVDSTDSVAYATNNGDSDISAYSIDGAGDLTPLAGSPFASDSLGPAGMVLSPDGSTLYVANGGFSGNADVSMYAVAADGSIAPLAAPAATGGSGQATGIGYLSGEPPPSVLEIPTLGRLGLVALVLLLVAAAVLVLRRIG